MSDQNIHPTVEDAENVRQFIANQQQPSDAEVPPHVRLFGADGKQTVTLPLEEDEAKQEQRIADQSPLPAHASFDGQEAMAGWVFQSEDHDLGEDLRDIVVSDVEKRAFVRAFTFDEVFRTEFERPCPGGFFTVGVRSITKFEEQVVDAALAADLQEGIIHHTDAIQRLTRFQQYVFSCMLERLGLAYFDTFKGNPELPIRDQATELRKYCAKVFGPMSGIRFGQVVKACIIFEAKQTTCLRKVKDLSFWKTP